MSAAADLIREIEASPADLPASKLVTWPVLARRVKELEEIAWLAEDMVVSAPHLPTHPTVGRVIEWVEKQRQGRG